MGHTATVTIRTVAAPRFRLPARGRPLRFRDLLRGSDTALVYAGVVLGVSLALHLAGPRFQAEFVQRASTNIDNLRRFPFRVLLLSSVVVPGRGLVILAPLVVALTASQRWLGRVPTLVVFGVGHVGTTLVVAVVLVSQLTHGRLDPAVAHAPDVGVSYGLACVVGLLAARVPVRLRTPYVLLTAGPLVGVLVVQPDFTALGHVTALALGLGLAVVASRAASAARRG